MPNILNAFLILTYNFLANLFLIIVFDFFHIQKLRKEVVETLEFHHTEKGLAAVFCMETRLLLNVKQLLNWWERERLHVNKTTSGLATNPAVFVRIIIICLYYFSDLSHLLFLAFVTSQRENISKYLEDFFSHIFFF